MGGKTAMKFAFEYSHRINKLVVIDIALRQYPVFHQNIMEGLFVLDLKQIKSRKEADVQLAAQISSRRIRQFLLKNLYRGDDGSFVWRINLAVIADNLHQIGSEITAKKPFNNPTLFIRGGDSDYIMESDLGQISEMFTKSRVTTIPGASHWVHAEAPEEVFKLIAAFLSDTGS